MASDSEDEGVTIEMQHTITSSSSHKGLGLKTAGEKRGNNYLIDEANEETDGSSIKKKRNL